MRSMKARGGLTHGRGINESSRHQWVYSMHYCAAVQEARTSLTQRHHATSEQHAELGKSRCKQDSDALKKLLDWIEEHNPFSIEVCTLTSLASGLTATDENKINCDQTEEVGEKIQKALDGICISSAHIKRSEQIRMLYNLQPGVKIDKKITQIDPTVLFMRCMALVNRESDDVASYLKYELSAIPMALFKDFFMCKTDKAELARCIKKDLTNLSQEFSNKDVVHVIDGGWLLHHLRWNRNKTYIEVAEKYENFIRNRYGICHIVFDGYDGPSTKDHEHLRRSGTTSAYITVRKDSRCHKNQEAFLSNAENKAQFIGLLVVLGITKE